MKITEIEVIPLRVPYKARIRKAYYHFAMREEVAQVVKDAEFQWEYGMYGPLRAGLQSKRVER